MVPLFRVLALALSVFSLNLVVAQTTAVANETVEQKLTKIFKERYPTAEVTNVKLSPVAGLYEVVLGSELVFTEATGRYIFAGPLLEAQGTTNEVKNYSDERINQLFGFKWANLPFDKAIKMVRGKGTRQIAVFSDADCPFCKRIEQTFAQVDDVTVYTFLMPIDSLHPDAGRKSKIIWCSKDRLKSWLDYMLNGKLVDGKGDCANPVDELKALGQKHKVNGTPALVFPNDKTIPGALPKDRLELELTKAFEETKKKS